MHASQDAAIAAIDLKRLATLCGCTVGDLSRFGAQDVPALAAVGVVGKSGQGVVFEREGERGHSWREGERDESGGLDTALMSLASRPGVLDTSHLPKALLQLAGEPVIAHVLRQLQVHSDTAECCLHT